MKKIKPGILALAILFLFSSQIVAQSSCSCSMDATVQAYKTKVESAVDNQSCTQCVNLSIYLCAARYCENKHQKAKLQQMIETCRFAIRSTPGDACCPELLTAPVEWCTKSCNESGSNANQNGASSNTITQSAQTNVSTPIAAPSSDLNTTEDIKAITNFAASMLNDMQGAEGAMRAFLGNQVHKDSSGFGAVETVVMDNLIKHMFSSSSISGRSDYNVLGGLLNKSAANLTGDFNTQLYSNALSGIGLEGLAQVDLAGLGQLMDLLSSGRADKQQNERLKQDLIPLYSNAVQNSAKYIKQVINRPHDGKRSELFMDFSPCSYFGYCDYRVYISLGSSTVYKYNGKGGVELVGKYDENLFRQNANLATKTIFGKEVNVVFADSSQILPQKVDMRKINMPKGIGMNFLVADQQVFVNPATKDFFKLNPDGTHEKIGEFKSPDGYKRYHYYVDFFTNKYSGLLATTTPQKPNSEGTIFLFDNFSGNRIKEFNYRNLPFALSYQYNAVYESKISLFKIDVSERYLITSAGEQSDPIIADIGNSMNVVKGYGKDLLAIVDLEGKEQTRIVGEPGSKILDFDISKDYQFLVLLRNTPDMRVEIYHFRTGRLIRSISTFVQPFSISTTMDDNKRFWYGSSNNSKVSITYDNKYIMLDYCLSGRKSVAVNNRLMLISLEDIVVDMLREGMAKK